MTIENKVLMNIFITKIAEANADNFKYWLSILIISSFWSERIVLIMFSFCVV